MSICLYLSLTTLLEKSMLANEKGIVAMTGRAHCQRKLHFLFNKILFFFHVDICLHWLYSIYPVDVVRFLKINTRKLVNICSLYVDNFCRCGNIHVPRLYLTLIPHQKDDLILHKWKKCHRL